jgi:D-alanyl-D-alanine carboxypeptidase
MLRTLAVLALVACAAEPSPSQPTQGGGDYVSPFDPELGERLQAALDAAREQIGAPGATLAVSVPGEGIWVGGSGLSDQAQGVAMDPEERLRIGSITKTYVSAVAVQMADEGLWSLDDPISVWLDGLPPDVQPITLRLLLSHTSGIVNTADLLELIAHFTEPWSAREIVDVALEEELLFEPGTGYSYSNTNFMLLGLAIESATGETLATQVRARLLEPNGLEHTFLEGDEPIEGTMSLGYLGGTEVTDSMEIVWSWATGHMVASASDLVRWNAALLRSDVHKRATLEMVTSPTVLPDGTVVGYGLGISLHDRGGEPAIGHTGSTMGFQSDMFCRASDSELCVAALCNDFGSEASVIAQAAWDELPTTD